VTHSGEERVPLCGGGELRLTVVAPDCTARGGILVAPPAREVTSATRRLATGLAGEGWLAVIPYLYHEPLDHQPRKRTSHTSTDGLADGWGARGPAEPLTVSGIDAATGAAFAWLLRQGVAVDRLGVMGCELGGAVALIVATRRDLGAAVTVGGTGIVQPVVPSLPPLVDVAPELRCPWLGIYPPHGEPPEEEVHKLRDAAHSARVATDLVRCGFDPDQSAAPEAWARTLNWFDCHLR
jgi:carboxymethylenebutenolidase